MRCTNRFYLVVGILVVCVFFLSFISAESLLLSDQGTDVRDISTGQVLRSGNLTVQIWDAASSGNKIYEQVFTNAIVNGSWNVMLNTGLNLEYGNTYYKDYLINGDNLDFDGSSRLAFISPLGLINNLSRVNLSLIGNCSSGYAIRRINSDGTVSCEQINGTSSSGNGSDGTGGWTNTSVTTSTDLNVSIGGNLSVVNYGFFGWLGSFANRITKLFVQDIDVSGSMNVSGSINVTGNVTASYYCNSSNCYTLTDFLGNSSGVSSGSSYNETYNLYAYNQTYTGGTYNETYNMWAYNQTTTSTSTYNASYDAKVSAVNNGITLDISNITGFLYNYNQTSASSYNSSYNALIPYGYNQSTYAIDYLNQTYGQFWYNMSDGTGLGSSYNATYHLWAYNQTYTGGTFNETYNLWAYNQTSSSTYNDSYVPYSGATGNLNLGIYNVTANRFCNSSNCYTIAEFLSGAGAEADPVWTSEKANYYTIADINGFNESWLATYNSSYNSLIPYGYNQSQYLIDAYGQYWYNMTSTSTGTYNETYNLYAYNQTYTAGSYNATYALYAYNQTYSGSTYNATYNMWAYNQTSASTYNATYDAKVSAVNNGITLDIANITNFLYNYNQTEATNTLYGPAW
ncbi:MAG: hypothetical protein WC796_04675, partial [Candidatus Pacearchaeota archaeon]